MNWDGISSDPRDIIESGWHPEDIDQVDEPRSFRVGDRVVNTATHQRGTVQNHDFHIQGSDLWRTLVAWDGDGEWYVNRNNLTKIEKEDESMEPTFEEGQYVTVTLPGEIDYVNGRRLSVDVMDGDEEITINVDRDQVEIRKPEKLEPGQMYRKGDFVFIVFRDGRLSAGGSVRVMNVYTGNTVDESVLLGAKMIADGGELR